MNRLSMFASLLILYIPGTPKWDACHDFLQITSDLLGIWISCMRDGFRIELHGCGGISAWQLEMCKSPKHADILSRDGKKGINTCERNLHRSVLCLFLQYSGHSSSVHDSVFLHIFC
jgi:hypothetical protein